MVLRNCSSVYSQLRIWPLELYFLTYMLFFGQCTCLIDQRRWCSDRVVKGYTPAWAPKISLAEIEERVMKACTSHDKINAEKVSVILTHLFLCFFLQNKLLSSIKRNYSLALPYTFEYIHKRVMLVLQLYDKIDPEKVFYFCV